MSYHHIEAMIPDKRAAHQVRMYFRGQDQKIKDLEETVAKLRQKLKNQHVQHALTVADLTRKQRDKDAKHQVEVARLQDQFKTLQTTCVMSVKNLAQKLEFEKSVNEHNMSTKTRLKEMEHRFLHMFNQAGDSFNQAAAQLWSNIQNELTKPKPGPALTENNGGASPNSDATIQPATTPFLPTGSDDDDMKTIKKESGQDERTETIKQGNRIGLKREYDESQASKPSKRVVFDEFSIAERKASLRSFAKQN